MTDEIKFLKRNLPQFPIDQVQEIAHNLFGVEGIFSQLSSERDQNFRVQTNDKGGPSYVLKIANAHEEPGIVDLQAAGLQHIAQVDPSMPVPQVIPTKDGLAYTTVQSHSGETHTVRLVSWLEGDLLDTVPSSPALWHNIGARMAQLDNALIAFHHPHAGYEMLWEVATAHRMRHVVASISDADTRQRIYRIFDHHESEVVPALKRLRHQVIHQDAHRHNVLVAAANPTEVSGVLDFGDMVYGPTIVELAIAIDLPDSSADEMLAKAGAVAAGYDALNRLSGTEIDLLYDLMLARMALTCCIIGWRKEASADDPEYLLDREEGIWESVATLQEIGRVQMTNTLRHACRFPTFTAKSSQTVAKPDDKGLIERRKQVMGEHLRWFYTQPVHFERGEGAWLITPTGERYLDGYNNVPVVGHSHPHVVQTISRQLAALNTNTRYLYQNIVDYAERLTATLAEPLNVCSFVNSGSEANDIAWRMAKHITGNEGLIIIEAAYHGITDAVSHMTQRRNKLGSHVETLIAPNPYRGLYRYGEPEIASKYAADVDRAIAALAERGYKPAAFIIDSFLMSNGTPDVPDGYVKLVVEKVRAAGGLFIGDEVQSGFARSGKYMWGHSLHEVIPDFVTLGKPVGNGFPLGVVITRPEILNTFVGDIGLFSTFGGNPVAAAAGMAVLDVIEREGIQQNALETGAYLQAGLEQLMEHHALIGNVRGRGTGNRG